MKINWLLINGVAQTMAHLHGLHGTAQWLEYGESKKDPYFETYAEEIIESNKRLFLMLCILESFY